MRERVFGYQVIADVNAAAAFSNQGCKGLRGCYRRVVYVFGDRNTQRTVPAAHVNGVIRSGHPAKIAGGDRLQTHASGLGLRKLHPGEVVVARIRVANRDREAIRSEERRVGKECRSWW